MVRRLRLPVQILPAIPDNNRYALATAAGGVAVWDWDLNTNDIFVDPSIRMMLGYDGASFRNRVFDWVRIVHPDDRALVLKSAQDCLVECGARFEVEHRMLHKSGKARWFVTRGSVVCDEQGNAIRMLGTTNDVTERKLAQLAVRESEERFRQLAENTPQIFWLMSADLQQLLYISPAYEEITGRPCSDLYTDPGAWLDAVHPEDHPRVMQAVQERLTGIRTSQTHMEYRYLRPDGTIRWMRAVTIPILDETGNMYRISGIAEDITETKVHEEQLCAAREGLTIQVEQRTMELTATVQRLEREIADRARIEGELRHSELRFRRLFESNIIGAMVADMHGQITEANEALLNMIGYTKSDLPLRWDRMTPAEWNAIDEQKVQQIMREGIASPYEKEYLRKDGTRVPIFLGAAMLDSEAGTCIAFVIDQTNRKRVEIALHDSSERLRLALKNARHGMWDWNIVTGHLVLDENWHAILGYTLGELPTNVQTWEQTLHPEDKERVMAVLQKHLVSTESLYDVDYRGRHKSGEWIWINSRGHVCQKDADGKPLRMMGTIHEISDRKFIEEEIRNLNTRLDQASRLSVMGEMVAGLAHEVHQPLAVIANYATGTIRRMKRHQASVKEIGNRLHEIASESMRAADVLRKIRQFLQRRETEREETHLNAIVQDALKLARFDREANQIEIIFQPESSLPKVFADPIQVTQVILNLVINAIQAMAGLEDRARRIVITTYSRESEYVEVSVADTGPGVPPELQSKIFEQFFTTKSQGLGMGLSISRSIVEAHGGQLWYDSSEGNPSVFRFTLPLRRAAPTDVPGDKTEKITAADLAQMTGDAG